MPLAVTRSGAWLSPDESRDGVKRGVAAFDGGAGGVLRSTAALEALAGCDVAFPLVHGTNGEDGTLQGFLETAGIPVRGLRRRCERDRHG